MIRIINGDMLVELPLMETESVDSCVTDPPYHLTSIVKRFGGTSVGDATQTSERSRKGADGYARLATGFMGKTWDGGDVAFRVETWEAVYRVLKPGGYLLAFGGPRNSHRMVCAIEDAGFEIRDNIAYLFDGGMAGPLLWAYASGFPKSLDVSKAIDRAAGAVREVIGPRQNIHSRGDHKMNEGWKSPWMDDPEAVARGMMETAPATDAAKQWQGFGTALKPAYEGICVARKPLAAKTVAANVLKYGTGALNIDASRIAAAGRPLRESFAKDSVGVFGDGLNGCRAVGTTDLGRFPANVCHDGSDEVLAAFAAFGESNSKSGGKAGAIGYHAGGSGADRGGHDDSGTAARFFFSSKADSADRADSKHPTVKPLDLLKWLVRLVCPPGGHVLDPFAGSGSTGEACMLLGMDCTLIEKEAEYASDIRHRIKRWSGLDAPLFAQSRSEEET